MTAHTPAPAAAPAVSRPIPGDFRLGVATAAYQIEGATHRDGRADSIWDARASTTTATATTSPS